MQSDNFRFEISPVGNNGKSIIKALTDKSTIHIDKFDLYSDRSRTAFVNKVSELAGIETAEIEQAFIETIGQYEQFKKPEKQTGTGNPLDNAPESVKAEAMAMLKSPDLLDIISRDIEKIGIAGEKDLRKQLYLIMTSRLLDKPLSGIVYGASASGKSYMIETIAKMMPDEQVIHAHDITPEALHYLPENSLVHKIVIAGERIEDKRAKNGKAEDNTKALREIIASGKLSKMLTVKDKDGNHVAKIIEQKGPIVYLESTTSTTIHDEDATRLLPLITDESSRQTESIIDAIKKDAVGIAKDKIAVEKILSKHKTAQRLLKQYAVRIPFADSLNLPYDVVSTRRAFPQLISFIQAIALLRQYRKQIENKNGIEFINADSSDYEIAFNLISKLFARIYSPVNQKSLELLNTIDSKTKNSADGFCDFTISQLYKWAGISESGIRRRLKELVNRGIIKENTESKPYVYTLDRPELLEQAELNLIDPEALEERLAIKSF